MSRKSVAEGLSILVLGFLCCGTDTHQGEVPTGTDVEEVAIQPDAVPGVKSKRALATITLEHFGWGVRGRSPLLIQCPDVPTGASGSFEARRADPP